jgi:hypothetical protein
VIKETTETGSSVLYPDIYFEFNTRVIILQDSMTNETTSILPL